MRDLSLKAIKIHGKRVKCEVCKKHCAVERFCGVLVCRRCLRAMALGFMMRRVICPPEEETEVGNDDTA